MQAPRYTLLNGRSNRARLDEDYRFDTGIKGHEARIEYRPDACQLWPFGTLIVYEGFVWDFGSGPAIDTPDMVIASLAHDALCGLTDRGLVPWSVRKQADKYFRYLLKINGCPWIRRWYAYLAVRFYSYNIARRRAEGH